MSQAATSPFWVIGFSADITIASQPLEASFYLINGSAALVAVDEIPNVSLSGLWDQFFSDLGPWPSGVIDLTLTDSTLFYVIQQMASLPPGVPASIAGQAANLAPGLYVATTVTLTLANTVFPPVALQVAAVKGQGFTIAADIGTPVPFIDANFLLLSDQSFSGKGPHFALQSLAGPPAKDSVTLACGFTLFNEQFAAGSITVTSAGGTESLAATLTYEGTLLGVTDPSLSFTWDPTNGFQVTDFPSVPVPSAVVDIVDELKKISSAEGCGDLASLVLNDVIQTAFYATPSVTTTKPTGAGSTGQLYVVITGYYKIFIGGSSANAGTPLVTIDLPTLVLTLNAPSAFTFAGIIDDIGTTITSNATAVIQQLWNDKASLAALVAAIVAPAVAEQVVSDLICDELEGLAEEFLEGLGADAFATAGEALAAAAGVIAAIAACPAGGNTGGRGTGPAGPALPAPANLAASYQNGAVVATWSAVSGSFGSPPLPILGYRAQLIDASRKPVGPVQFLPATATTASFPLAGATMAAGTAFVQVLSRAAALTDAVDSAFANQPITKLAAPAGVTLTADATGQTVTASWNQVSGAASYAVSVQQGAAVAASAAVPQPAGAAAPSQSWPASGFATHAAGAYLASVQALGGATAVASDPGVSAPLPMLAPPASLTQTVLADRLQVTFPLVAGATGYRVEAINVDTFAQAVAISLSGALPLVNGLAVGDLMFAHFPTPAAGHYRTSIVAFGDARHIASFPATAATTSYLFPAPPTGVALSWNGSQLLAQWNPVSLTGAGTITYNVNLYDAAGTTIVGTVAGAAAPGVAVTLASGAAIAAGQSFRAAVATVAGAAPGPFSPLTAPFVITAPIPPPTGVTAMIEGTAVAASWQPVTLPAGVAGPLYYNAQLVATAAPNTPLAAAPAATATSASLTPIGSASVVAGQQYLVRVCATTGRYSSDWAQSAPFLALGTPVVTRFAYDPPGVLVEWQDVPNAESYEIAVRNSVGGLLQPPVRGTLAARPGQTPSATLAGSFTDGEIVTVIVRAVAGGNTGPWSTPGLAANAVGRLTIHALAAPSISHVILGSGGVTVTWTDATAPAGTKYEAALLRAGVTVNTTTATGLTATLAVPAAVGSTVHTVKVRATTDTSIGAWSPEAPVLLPPTNASLSWNAPDLLAHWTDPPVAGPGAVALAYHVLLYKAPDVTTIVGAVPDAAAPGAAVTLAPGAAYAPGETYRITVIALSGAVASAPSALSPPFPIVAIPLPTGVTMTVLGQSVLASWQPVAVPAGLSGQVTYIAQLVAAAQPDTPLAATPALPATSATLTTATAGNGSFVPGQQYLVRVRAVIGLYSGAWASSAPYVALAAPVVTTFLYDAPDVFAEWQEVPGADSYEVSVVDASGRALQPPVSTIVTPRPNVQLAAELQGSFTAGEVLTVKVRVHQGANIGPWSGPASAGDDRATLTVQVIPVPTITSVSTSGNAVTASWSNPNAIAGTGYIVGIFTRSGELVMEYPSPALTTTFNFVLTPGTTGADYIVQVRALAPKNWSLWSTAVPLAT